MPKRDWQADWELCKRATLGPWTVIKLYHNEPGYEQYIKSIQIVGRNKLCVTQMNWSNPVEADAEFIAKARKILPYWLQRVRELEVQIVILGDALQWIAQQPHDKRYGSLECPETDMCITEYCLPCYARQILAELAELEGGPADE